MRQDMAKVVTERPRRGHHATSLKTHRRINPRTLLDRDPWDDRDDCLLDQDFGPTRAPIARHRQYSGDAKEFSDLLGPLRGYLRKQVGRRWDDVYSELSTTLDKRSLTGLHIWGHIRSDVEIHTYLTVRGAIYVRDGYGGGRPVSGLYVHPNGFLCYEDERVARRRMVNLNRQYHLVNELRDFGFDVAVGYAPTVFYRRGYRSTGRIVPATPLVEADWIIRDKLTVLQRIHGVWFVHVFRALDPNEVVYTKEIHVDPVTLKGRTVPVYRRELKDQRRVERVSTRQIGKRELAQWTAKRK